jgi:hypothetical protein
MNASCSVRVLLHSSDWIFCFSYEAIRSIGRFLFGVYAKSNAQKLPMGVPQVLVGVIDRDSNIDNRTCAMNCLVNYVEAFMSVDSDAVACALRVVREQGPGELTDCSPVV